MSARQSCNRLIQPTAPDNFFNIDAIYLV